MANTRSAIKRMKQNEKRRQRNRATRSNIRSTVKAARAAVATPGPEAKDSIRARDPHPRPRRDPGRDAQEHGGSQEVRARQEAQHPRLTRTAG